MRLRVVTVVSGCVLILSTLAPGQPSSLPRVSLDVREIQHGVEVTAGGLHLQVTALSDHAVRVRYSRADFTPRVSFAVVGQLGPAPHAQVEQSGGTVVLRTAALQVRIATALMAVDFLDVNGNAIVESAARGYLAWNPDGFQLCNKMPPDEHYFGL